MASKVNELSEYVKLSSVEDIITNSDIDTLVEKKHNQLKESVEMVFSEII